MYYPLNYLFFFIKGCHVAIAMPKCKERKAHLFWGKISSHIIQTLKAQIGAHVLKPSANCANKIIPFPPTPDTQLKQFSLHEV